MRIFKKILFGVLACGIVAILIELILMVLGGISLYQIRNYRLTAFQAEDYAIFEETFGISLDKCRAVELTTYSAMRDSNAKLLFLMDSEEAETFIEEISNDYQEITNVDVDRTLDCLGERWWLITSYGSQSKQFTYLFRYEEKEGRILWKLQYRYPDSKIYEMARKRGEKFKD